MVNPKTLGLLPRGTAAAGCKANVQAKRIPGVMQGMGPSPVEKATPAGEVKKERPTDGACELLLNLVRGAKSLKAPARRKMKKNSTTRKHALPGLNADLTEKNNQPSQCFCHLGKIRVLVICSGTQGSPKSLRADDTHQWTATLAMQGQNSLPKPGDPDRAQVNDNSGKQGG